MIWEDCYSTGQWRWRFSQAFKTCFVPLSEIWLQGSYRVTSVLHIYYDLQLVLTTVPRIWTIQKAQDVTKRLLHNSLQICSRCICIKCGVRADSSRLTEPTAHDESLRFCRTWEQDITEAWQRPQRVPQQTNGRTIRWKEEVRAREAPMDDSFHLGVSV